jgi:glycine cleavage system regulatory protein
VAAVSPIVFRYGQGQDRAPFFEDYSMIPLVLTLIGDDKPGLVAAVSQAVAAHGGTWLESRLARLSGKFAGIVLVGAPQESLAEILADLRALENAGLKVAVEQGGEPVATAKTVASERLELEIVGHERPGIVRDLTQTLKTLGVNIEEFSSGLESAAFTGAEMFRAKAIVTLPQGLKPAEVRAMLEKLAGEIMVDLTLGEG